jgi:hypothetical protein
MRLIGPSVVLALGFAVAPLVTEAQDARKMPRIGWLTNSTVHAPNVKAFREGIRRRHAGASASGSRGGRGATPLCRGGS